MRGRLITIEGIDGAGKTTLATALRTQLARERPVTLLRDPGGTPLSERIRELVKDPAVRCDPRAEALLYSAARAQLVDERIAPLLDQGAWVLLDRFVDSALAYQGVARDLGVARVAELNAFATAGVAIDRTLLLRVDPAVARARTAGRSGSPDRLEREQEAFFATIATAYDALAASDPGRVRVLDADSPAGQVLALALEALADLDSQRS